jgi:HK97 family phage major capsid protein
MTEENKETPAVTPEATPGLTKESVSDLITKAVADALKTKAEVEANRPEITDLSSKSVAQNNGGLHGSAPFSFCKAILATTRGGGTPEGWKRYAPYEYKSIEASHQKAVAEGSVTSGTAFSGQGVLVAPEYSSEIIELIRAKTVVRKLGAGRYPAKSETGFIPRQTAGSSTTWVGEGSTLTEGSEPQFDQLQYTLRKLSSLAMITNEILEDASVDAEKFVMDSMSLDLALAEDLAYLYGSGSAPVPTGLWNLAGVSHILAASPNGQSPTFDNLFDLEAIIENNNLVNTGYAFNPRSKQSLRKLKDSYGRYLWDTGIPQQNVPASIGGVLFAMTTQIHKTDTVGSSAGVTSSIFAGQWDQMLIVEKGGIELKAAETGAAFLADSTYVRGILRRDMVVRHVGAFGILDGVLA